MYLINGITTNPLQTMRIILPNGDPCSLTLNFVPRQIGWFFNLTYQTFTLNGCRITNNPNILNQWKNIIPFGLACYTKQNREPTQLQDFTSQASSLYILSASEVEEITLFYQGVR